MDRLQRAKNLLIELEALKEQDGQGSPIGVSRVLSMTLVDAEILVREVLTEMMLREALERRKRARALFPGVRRAFVRVAPPQSARALLLRPWKRTSGSSATP